MITLCNQTYHDSLVDDLLVTCTVISADLLLHTAHEWLLLVVTLDDDSVDTSDRGAVLNDLDSIGFFGFLPSVDYTM